jgi:hypothetical protein
LQKIANWLDRIAALKPDEAKESIYRVILPGDETVGFTDTIVKLEHIGVAPARPGSTNPDTISILRLFDTSPPGLVPALVAQELGAVLALASDRRVEVAMEIMLAVQGRPPTERHLLPLGSVVDRRARGPFDERLRKQFTELVSRVPSLGKDDVAALGAATNLHYGAMLLCEYDLSSAYTLIVAGLEILSRAYGQPPKSWKDWEDSEAWDQVLADQALSPDQAAAIRAQLMKNRPLRLRATFRDYVVSRLPSSFWSEPWVEWTRQVNIKDGKFSWGPLQRHERAMNSILTDRDTLYAALGRSYDLRSKAVHEGQGVGLFEVALKDATPIRSNEPVTYPILRQILRTLVQYEIEQRSAPGFLPDIRFV